MRLRLRDITLYGRIEQGELVPPVQSLYLERKRLQVTVVNGAVFRVQYLYVVINASTQSLEAFF